MIQKEVDVAVAPEEVRPGGLSGTGRVAVAGSDAASAGWTMSVVRFSYRDAFLTAR